MKELVWHRQLLPTAERHADRPLVTDTGSGRTTTYGEHAARCLRLAHAMRHQLGLAPGDRAAVLALNSHRFLELYHGGMLGGGVTNPLNLRFAPRELVHVLRDSGTTVVFADGFFAGLVDQIRAEAGIERVVLLADGPADVPYDVLYEDLLAAAEEVVLEEPEEEDPALLMYTGGTTGLPKGVLLSQRALVLSMYHVGLVYGLDHTDVYLAQAPMFHAASLGAVLAVPRSGAALVTVPFFDPAAVLGALRGHPVTATLMVPTMLGMTFAHESYAPDALAGLRTLTYGASPMPAPVLAQLQRDAPHLELWQGYGMTESTALVTVLTPEDHRRPELLRSVGRPVAGTLVRVVSEDGVVLPPGAVGEVCLRGGQFLTGYWGRPDETAETLRGGWYHSGDAGYLDEGGYLFLVDRTKDMIVTGGENVYSTEVEQALASAPGVAQVAVIGIPDDTWGEAVHAVVVRAPGPEGDALTEDGLIAHAHGLIAGYKVPKSVTFQADPLPLSGAMKVLKRELRAPYWEGRDRAIN